LPENARHLCKDCSRLGASELQHRRDLRNLERLVTWEGVIGRKKRKAFNGFLEHLDLRIRRYAEEPARPLPESLKQNKKMNPAKDQDLAGIIEEYIEGQGQSLDAGASGT
jgi:hypothetical protein